MNNPRTAAAISLMITLPIALLGCSGSSSEKETETPEFEADTSYLDDLAEDKGIDTSKSQPVTQTQTNEPQSEDLDDNANEDEEREWIAAEGSKSILGRARDKAKDVVDLANNSTEPENGLANTTFDEEYAQAAGYAWDMPEDWKMAVPAKGSFAEMYIQNPLGNASIVFTKESASLTQIRRSLESTMSDTFGGSSKTRTTKKTVSDFSVTIFELDGTYLDPSGKGNQNGSPFYAIHAAVIELPTSKILIKLWGPEDTVKQNLGKFESMIDKMYER